MKLAIFKAGTTEKGCRREKGALSWPKWERRQKKAEDALVGSHASSVGCARKEGTARRELGQGAESRKKKEQTKFPWGNEE